MTLFSVIRALIAGCIVAILFWKGFCGHRFNQAREDIRSAENNKMILATFAAYCIGFFLFI